MGISDICILKTFVKSVEIVLSFYRQISEKQQRSPVFDIWTEG